MEIKKVFVIIVTYNGKQWYEKCFNSLRLSEIPISTIVIDNASSDDTIEYIKYNYPEIHLISSNTNLGFGQANNLGIKYALKNNGDYIFLLNQDTWINSDTISGLIKIHQKNVEFGILSPMHINAQENGIESGLLEYIANFRITDSTLISDMYFNQLNDIYETKYVNAAAWLLHRKTIEKIGGFDPIFFHYGEDDNYMQRILYHGYKIGICPKQQIIHDTVRQVKRSYSAQKSNLKITLTEYTNINVQYNQYSIIFYYLRKVLGKLIQFKFKQLSFFIEQLIFIMKNNKRIRISRVKNISTGITWL